MSHRRVLTFLAAAAVLAACVALPAQAQNFQIEATVVLEDGTPVKGAKLIAQPQGEGRKVVTAKTKKDGTCKLPFVKYGIYAFKIEAKGLLMLKSEILIEQRGNKYESDDTFEFGPDQALKVYEIKPGREVTLTVTMVPDSHFAGMLAIAGAPKLNAKLEKANAALIEGNFEQTDKLLDEILQEKEDAASAHYLRGLSKARQADLDSAEFSFRKAHEYDPKLAGVCAQLGTVLYSKGDKQGAVEWFEKELALSPDAVPVATNYAIILTDIGEVEPAVAAWQRVIDLNPTDSNAYAELAGIYVTAEREDEAIAVLERMEEIAKPSAAHWYNIGANLSNRDQFERATMAFQKAAELDPEMPQPRRELGYLLIKQGKMAEALSSFKKYLELSPDAVDKEVIEENITLLSDVVGGVE